MLVVDRISIGLVQGLGLSWLYKGVKAGIGFGRRMDTGPVDLPFRHEGVSLIVRESIRPDSVGLDP